MKSTIETVPVINTVLFNSELSDTGKLIYIYLTEKLICNTVSKDYFKFNKSEIAKELNISRPNLDKALKELINNNFYNPETKTLYYYSVSNSHWEIKNIRDFSNSELVKDMNGFLKASKDILYSKDLKANEKITFYKFQSAYPKLKLVGKVHLNGLATISNTELKTFNNNVRKLKEMGYINYTVKRNSKNINDTEIIVIGFNTKPMKEPIKSEIKEEKEKPIEKPVKETIKPEVKEKETFNVKKMDDEELCDLFEIVKQNTRNNNVDMNGILSFINNDTDTQCYISEPDYSMSYDTERKLSEEEEARVDALLEFV